MKKYTLFFSLLCVLPALLKAQQTPTQVMQKARAQCMAITNGKYTLVRKFKFFSETDTLVQNGEVVFEKAPADELFNLHFWLANNTDSFARYYDGKQMYTVEHKKREVIIDTARGDMNSSIRGNISGGFLRFPFTDTLPMRALDDTTYHPIFDPAYKNNKDTIVIFIKLPPENGQPDNDEWVRWYFDAKNGYPIAKEAKFVNDNEVQYEHFLVTSYTFNNKKNTDWLNGPKWPKEFNLEYRKPYVRPELLPNDTIAPDWVALSITGDSLQLSKLKGKLFLVDFWFRACGPCVQAMPTLQSLHEKYADKGLQIIGLNPFDYKKKDSKLFVEFIERRSVTYPLAFIERAVADTDYRVSGYPTFYLISSDGKIVHSQVGFSENLHAEVENIVSQYLDTH